MTSDQEPSRAWPQSRIDYEWLVAQVPVIPEHVLDAVARRLSDAIDAQIVEDFIKGKKALSDV